MGELSIKLLGGPIVTKNDGTSVRIPTRKAEALLAYLVERGGEATSREALADLLWPHSGAEQARGSLRQEISVLRKALGPEWSDLIVAQGDRIQVSTKGLDVDVWHIRSPRMPDHSPADILPLLQLYTAPFLDTFRIRSQPFSDWVWATQQSLETETLGLGQLCLRACLERQDSEKTVYVAQELCRIEPTFEPAHRALIETYLSTGDVGSAQRQFRQCEYALKTYLDAEVSEETRLLMERAADTTRPMSATIAATPQPARPARQRRFITALSVAANLQIEDPEDFDRATKDCTRFIRGCIEAEGGTVLWEFGDHVLAYFGYPVGHDSDPDTAVFTALKILDALERRGQDTAGYQLGLSYGQALVSEQQDIEAGQAELSGAVLQMAEATTRRGPFGAVTVDLAVELVLSSAIRLEPIGGKSGIKRAISRREHVGVEVQDLLPERIHPIVGRDVSLAHLVGLLEQAKSGQGTVAAVLGQPGEGKSRLVQEVVEKAVALGFEIRIFQGNRSQRHSTLSPVLDQMYREGAFGTGHLQTDLEGWLSLRDPELSKAAPYFAALVDDARKDVTTAKASLSAKTAALDIFTALAKSGGRKRIAMLVFEDVQWFDPTTCEAISRFIEKIADMPAFAVLVSRIDESPNVVHHPEVQKITLGPLEPRSAERLLQGLIGKTQPSPAMLKNILDRAEGNPLVLEEFAKSIVFRQNEPPDPLIPVASPVLQNESAELIEAPSRLLPLLLSRIDSISCAIQLLQYASVIGRKFSEAQLAKIAEPLCVEQQLFSELESAGILFATHIGGDTSYIFKHALISEAIYATIPKRERKAIHLTVGEALLADPQRPHFSEAAHHFKAATDYDRAAQYFELSGDQAARVSANSEAISEYHEAIVMTENLPSAPARLRKELVLNRKTASQLIALRGIPTHEVAQYYDNAQSLSAKLGDVDEIVNCAWGLWSMHLMVAEMDQCLDTATELAATVERLNAPAALIISEYMLGVTHAYRGTLPLAASHLETVLETYSKDMKDELLLRFGMDIGLTANSFLGWVYALHGRVEDADAASQRALEMAQSNHDGLSLVFADVFTATKCLFLDRLTEAQHHSERALNGATEMGFTQWIAQAKLQLARVADLSGDENALYSLQQARDDYIATGMVLARVYADVWIAEAQIRRGLHRAALTTLDALRKHTDGTNQKYFDFAAQRVRTSLQHSHEPVAISVLRQHHST